MKRFISAMLMLMIIITLTFIPYPVHADQEQDDEIITPETRETAPSDQSTIQHTEEKKVEGEYACGYDGTTRVALYCNVPRKQPRYEFSLRKWLAEKDDILQLSGDLREDIITVARLQIGYYEDITLKESPGKNYTMYGEWYGRGWYYSEWCDMFVSFCVNYAGFTDYPFETSCQRHMLNLKEAGYWREWNNYIPQMGDIVFLNLGNNDTGIPTHAAIVEQVVPATASHPAYLKTIEGNINIGAPSSGVGREIRYFQDVVGYGTYEVGQTYERKYSFHFDDHRDVAMYGTERFVDYPSVVVLEYIGMGDTEYFNYFFANGIDDISDAIEKENAMLTAEINELGDGKECIEAIGLNPGII